MSKSRPKGVGAGRKEQTPAIVAVAAPVRVALYRDDEEAAPFFQSARRPLRVILATALAVRFVQFLLIRANDPVFAHFTTGLDSVTYDSWAKSIDEGDWLSRKTAIFYMGPLYSYFLAVIYGLTGHSYSAAHLAQFVLGAASTGLVFLAGAQWFSRRVAFVAGLAVALCPTVIYYESLMLPESLSFFLVAVFILCLGLTSRRPERWWMWLIAGAALGLAAVQRGNALLCALGVLAWLAVGFPEWRIGRRAALAGVFLGGLALTIAPATLHNRLFGGEWVLITSNGPVNLYIGNGKDAPGIFAYPPGYEGQQAKVQEIGDRMDAARKALAEAKTAGNAERVGALERDLASMRLEQKKFWRHALLAEIRAAPGAWIGLMLKKVYIFWAGFDPPDNYSFDIHQRFSFVERFGPARFSLIVALGLAGLMLGLRRWRALLPLYGFVATFFLSVVLVFVSGRFRLPVLTVTACFAGLAFWQGYAWLRSGRHGRLSVAAAAVVALIVLLNLYTVSPFKIRWNDFAMISAAYQQAGKPDRALAILRDGERYLLRQDPRTSRQEEMRLASLLFLRNTLARTLLAQEKWREAERVLQSQLGTGIMTPEQVNMLVKAYLEQGKNRDALDLVRTMARQEPENAQWRDLEQQIAAALGNSI